MKKRMKILICAGIAVICLLSSFLYYGTRRKSLTIDEIDHLYAADLKRFGFQYELLNLSDPFDRNTAVKLYGQISSPYEPAWVEIYAIQQDTEAFEQLIDRQIPLNAVQKKNNINGNEYVFDVFQNRQPLDSKITYAVKVRTEAGSFGLLFTFNLIKTDDPNGDQKCMNSIIAFLNDSRILRSSEN